jgi:hypothetical protein
MLFASGRTRRSLSDPAQRQRANHKLAYSWRLPATNAKEAERISHGAANNRLTIGRYGSSPMTSTIDTILNEKHHNLKESLILGHNCD